MVFLLFIADTVLNILGRAQPWRHRAENFAQPGDQWCVVSVQLQRQEGEAGIH